LITRALNLVVAFVTGFIALAGAAHDPDIMSWILAGVGLCWLAGGLGLYLVKGRLAWCGSLLGAGTMLAVSVSMLVEGIKVVPFAQDPTDGTGLLLVVGTLGIFLSVPLIIGLIRLRKDMAFVCSIGPHTLV